VSRVLDRPWRNYIDSKVLYFAYFYAVWVTLKFANMAAGDMPAPHHASWVVEYLWLFIEPPTGPLWFIYILAFFFIAVRLSRRMPPLLVLGAAIALEVADLQTGIKLADKFALYFVYFYSGHLFARHVFRGAQWSQSNPRRALGLLLVWISVHSVLLALDWESLPGMKLLLGYAGAVAVMLVSTLLANVSWMGWLSYLGRHSIVIYLGFVVPLGLIRKFIVNSAQVTDVGSLSLIVTVIAVAGALCIYWAVNRTPLRFLFAYPSWLSLEALHVLGLKRSLHYRKMLKILS
jgi:uncharacterized membrane protein YcfT